MSINSPLPNQEARVPEHAGGSQETAPSMEDQILAAAESCFLEYGFDKASTTMIAKQVGCNQALIHYYYRTKLNLFTKVFERKFLIVYAQMTAAPFIKSASFTDKVTLFIETHFDMVHRDPRLAKLIVNELHRLPTLVAEVKRLVQEKPLAMLQALDKDRQAAIDNGEIRPITLMDLALTVLSLNLAPLMLMPVLANILPLDEQAQQAMMAARRQQIVTTVLNSLRP